MAKAMAGGCRSVRASAGRNGDGVPYDVRPEAASCACARDMALFANLRPAICYPALAASSLAEAGVVEASTHLIVRELTGGVYFGEPKEIIDLANGQKRGIDTQSTTRSRSSASRASPSSSHARARTT